jgi:hypothetical protein
MLLIVCGAVVIIRPAIGNIALRKLPLYFGGVIKMSEEQKNSRPFFVRLLGFGWIIGGILIAIDSAS